MAKTALNLYEELTENIRNALQGVSFAYEVKESVDNLMIKSFHIIINGYSYFRVSVNLGARFTLRCITEPCEVTFYSMFIYYYDRVSFFSREGKLEFNGISQVINDYFTFPYSSDKDKEYIVKLANHFLDVEIPSSIIEYDLRNRNYFFTDWRNNEGIENRYWRELFKTDNDKELTLAKYMSFDTFIKTLQSGNMRMNSIIGMNDRSELNFINQYLYSEKTISTYDDSTFESLYEANRRYITSFTTLIDDLNMWRLYGNDSAGVCLVFESITTQSIPLLYPVCYVDDERRSPIMKVKLFIDELKKEGINFSFNSLNQWRNFFKSKNYSYEKEYRLLVIENIPTGWMICQDNGILMPYIEKKINNGLYNNINDKYFPLKLSEVILGSKMQGKEENIYQLSRMSACLGSASFHVSISKENTYR